MKETWLTGKRRSTTIAATPDDEKRQRKRIKKRRVNFYLAPYPLEMNRHVYQSWSWLDHRERLVHAHGRIHVGLYTKHTLLQMVVMTCIDPYVPCCSSLGSLVPKQLNSILIEPESYNNRLCSRFKYNDVTWTCCDCRHQHRLSAALQARPLTTLPASTQGLWSSVLYTCSCRGAVLCDVLVA